MSVSGRGCESGYLTGAEVRAVIDRAAALLDKPLSLLALVVTPEGVAGVFCD